MRLDLTSFVEGGDEDSATPGFEDESVKSTKTAAARRWIAQPRSIRLSTRPRLPLHPDGTRSRTFTRISKSGPMPSFAFNLASDVGILATRLVDEALLPLFRKLHPEKSGWNLSLVNICVAKVVMSASEVRVGAGRDIGKMFRKQDDTLKHWKVDDIDVPPDSYMSDVQSLHDAGLKEFRTLTANASLEVKHGGSEDTLYQTQSSLNGESDWGVGADERDSGNSCTVCGATMPAFAMIAHERFHDLAD